MAGITPDVRTVFTDGTEVVARTTFADTLAWENYAGAHDLDLMSPMHMLAFYAWRDARKSGRCGQDVGLEVFAERIAEIEPCDEEPVNPTRPVPGDG